MQKYDLEQMLIEINEDEAVGDVAPKEKRLSQAEIRKMVLERRAKAKEQK